MDKGYIRKRREDGATLQEIANELGVSRQAVHQKLKQPGRMRIRVNEHGVALFLIDRVAKGVRSGELAAKSGIPQASLTRWEKNPSTRLNRTMAVSLCKALGKDPEELFEEVI